jgi:outer membrane protein assembly factor BamE (lipoprotein component of BamABCDE complex)
MRRLAFGRRVGLGIAGRSGKRKAAERGAIMRPNIKFSAARLVAAAGALTVAAALSGCLGYDGDFDRGYQIDQQSLEQLKIGQTTKPQALALMGTPSTTSTIGGDAWYYIGQKYSRSLAFMPAKMTDQSVLAVYFDKSGKVARIANYGMKDGEVFDFVSRTTPTGGDEPNFLRNIMTGLFRFT